MLEFHILLIFIKLQTKTGKFSRKCLNFFETFSKTIDIKKQVFLQNNEKQKYNVKNY